EPKRVGTSLPPASEPVIGYMGTGGHVEDLAAIIPVIERLLEERPALSFELFGSLEMPFELMRFGDRVRKLPFMKSYEEFTETLANLGWWVGLAPLVDNVFNGCKADTKWVEYASAGIPVVASNTPVYDYACQGGAGLMADGPAGWYQAINMLLDNHQMRADQTAKADAHLRANYSHQRLLAQVEHVFAAAQHLAKQRKVRDGQASMAFAGGQTT
ncbi:MAG: glycosyltransferase, partial [Pseudomonadota bacterium]